VLLNELGFDDGLLTPLRERYLSVIARRLFPEVGGDSLDSHRAFVVSYGRGADDGLDLHYDNSEVTVNISLDDQFEGGELYIGRMQSVPLHSELEYCPCRHRLGCGLLHRGQQMHGALPLSTGVRHNLIMWMRSSETRNQLCPMCHRKPDLVRVSGTGDGYSMSDVSVCSVLWSCRIEDIAKHMNGHACYHKKYKQWFDGMEISLCFPLYYLVPLFIRRPWRRIRPHTDAILMCRELPFCLLPGESHSYGITQCYLPPGRGDFPAYS